MELLRFSESYSDAIGTSLLDSPLHVDYIRDLSFKEINFVTLYKSFKDTVANLNNLKCIECPAFAKHVISWIFFWI